MDGSWVDRYLGNEWVHGWVDRCVGGWVDGRVDGCVGGWVDGQVDGWVDEWMDKWLAWTTKKV